MSKFIPKIVNERGNTFILLDDVFCHEEAIEYCKEHKHDIKFTCGNYTCATEILCKIYEAGYTLRPIRRTEKLPGGCGDLDYFDTVYCYREVNV